jgi:hypothetical protein
MKASELRIGNSIMQDEDFVFVTYWRLKLIEDGVLIYKPIPLTEKWLSKFGFKKYNFTNKENGYIIENKEASKSIYIRTFIEPNTTNFFNVFNRSECERTKLQFIKSIKYVHQLQNLYFALTDKEL